MQNIRIIAIMAFAVLLTGAGCTQKVDTAVNEAIVPIELSAEAKRQAEELATANQAQANLELERESDDVSVALIRIAKEGDTPKEDAIGCNDLVEFVKVHRATASGDTVRDALATLFSLKEASHGELYHSLAFSTLSVDDIRSPDGVTTEVRLKGKVSSSGACDDPRIKAQVERTISRFRPKFRVLLNGSEREWRCLGDQSGECK